MEKYNSSQSAHEFEVDFELEAAIEQAFVTIPDIKAMEEHFAFLDIMHLKYAKSHLPNNLAVSHYDPDATGPHQIPFSD